MRRITLIASLAAIAQTMLVSPALAQSSNDRFRDLDRVIAAAEKTNQSKKISPTPLLTNDKIKVQQDEGRSLEKFASGTEIVSTSGPLDREGSGTSSDDGFALPEFELSTNDSRVIANLGLSFAWNDVKDKKVSEITNDYRFDASSLRFSAKVAVPINSNDGRQFADFKKIGDDSTLTFSLVYYHSTDFDGPTRVKGTNLAYGQCLFQAGKKWVEASVPAERVANAQDAQSFYEQYLNSSRERPDESGDGLIGDIADDAENPNEFNAIAKASCVPSTDGAVKDDNDVVRRFGADALGEAYPSFVKTYIEPSLWFGGVDVSAGYEKYDILDRTAFLLKTIDRVGFDAKGFYGVIRGDGKLSGRLSAGYARGYTTQAETEYCRATAIAGEQKCLKGQDGLPTKKKTGYLKGEMRFIVAEDKNGTAKIALAPEITFDLKDKEFVFDLPVYLQRSKDKGLDGGIRFGYTTNKNDFGIGVFIGVPFATWF